MTSHENVSTETLFAIQRNLLKGLDLVGEHIAAGTFRVSKKEGSAPPSQAGWLTLILLLGIEDELEARIRGFQRTIDPRLCERGNGAQETSRDDRGSSSSFPPDRRSSKRVRSAEAVG